MSDTVKKKHTLANCDECSRKHSDYQKAFPSRPIYSAPPLAVVLQKNEYTSEKEECKQVISELNEQWQSKYSHSLSSIMPALAPQENLITKQTKLQKKKVDRDVKRKVVTEVSDKMAERNTITLLAEADSLSSYSRKRLAMSFETPKQTNKRQKTHSPSEVNQLWSRENAKQCLENFPTDRKINWTSLATELNIPGRNKGQVLKEFASKENFDIQRLEKKDSPSTPRIRRHKKKLTCQEISMPCLPTPKSVKQEKQALIDSGELTLGEPCTPHTITKCLVALDGEVKTIQINLVGRKIPITYLRKSLLLKYKKYMRLSTDAEIQQMTEEQILSLLSIANHQPPNVYSLGQLQSELATIQRTRNIAIWHDHSTILKNGYILFAIRIVYDAAVFLTESEYSSLTLKNIQETVEQPVIYIISPSSSSPSDQIALIGDRVECLQEMAIPLKASNGVVVSDTMRFFCGDKPAQQFERGTQIGGTYKCGGCGCKDVNMQDLAYALRCSWRSLTDLQALVLQGKFGCASNTLKPLENLKAENLRQELETRGYDTTRMLRPEMQQLLSSILKGAQRVPTLLTLNPKQSLSSLNLLKYEVMDCEPLHDFKGHASHLLTELTKLLSGQLQKECRKIIETTAAKPASGTQLRLACIKVYLRLLKESSDIDSRLIDLMRTIVKISHILYQQDSERTPKAVLQLYNVTWVHHHLCLDLIGTPKEITTTKFYGVYLHDLVVHAPLQYHLVCLRSTNSESQERLFSQAKNISQRNTNRKPENVLPNILLSLQAREKTETHQNTIKRQDSSVAIAARQIPEYTGTTLSTAYTDARQSSWQAHLERIATFLKQGEGVWWRKEGEYFIFSDADTDCGAQPVGPNLLHFRSNTLKDVAEVSKCAWQQILCNETSLPAVCIRLFDNHGNYTGRTYFHGYTRDTFRNITLPTLTSEDSPSALQSHCQILSESTDDSMLNLTDIPNLSDVTQAPTTPVLNKTISCLPRAESSTNKDSSHSFQIGNLHIDSVIASTDTNISDTIGTALKTKAAGQIQKALGYVDEDVQNLDKLRKRLKEKSTNKLRVHKDEKEQYEKLLARIHTKLLLQKSKLKTELKTIENDHFQRTGTCVMAEEDTQYQKLIKDIKFLKSLICTWHSLSL